MLPAVKELERDLFEAWEEYVVGWRRIVPNVQQYLSIRLSSTPPATESLPLAYQYEAWPDQLSLHSGPFHPCMYEFALKQIHANPGLRSLCLGDSQWDDLMEYHRAGRRTLLRAVGSLRGLKDLTVSDSSGDWLNHDDEDGADVGEKSSDIQAG